MKKIAITLSTIFLLSICFQAQAQTQKKPQLNWLTVKEAVQKQKKDPKIILIDVYTVWCGPCRMMAANTYTDSKVVEYINKYFYVAKFDAESPDSINVNGHTYTNPNYDPKRKGGRNGTNQLTYAIAQVKGRGIAYPTSVFMGKDLQILQAIQGYLKPEQFLPILTYFAEDYYENIPWQDFVKKYNSGELKQN